MKIEVKGNINFFLNNKDLKIKSYSVFGKWKLNQSESLIHWANNDVELGTQSGDFFYKMCQKIQGSNYDNLEEIFREFKIKFNAEKETFQELDLIKATANLFLWYQYFFVEEIEQDPSFKPLIFDAFIIDNNRSLGVQKDIYLLKEKFLQDEYSSQIQNLIQINLLSSFEITYKEKTLKNYFIPFTKPGYKEDIFQDTQTLKLWKDILKDRNFTLHNFFNQR